MKCFAWIYLQARRSHATVPTIPDPKRRMLPGSGVVPEPAESRTVNDSNPIVPVDWNACEGATRLNVLERSLHVGPRTFITTPLRSKGLEFGLSCSCILKYASSRGRGNGGNPEGISKECGKSGKPASWLSMLSTLCHFQWPALETRFTKSQSPRRPC